MIQPNQIFQKLIGTLRSRSNSQTNLRGTTSEENSPCKDYEENIQPTDQQFIIKKSELLQFVHNLAIHFENNQNIHKQQKQHEPFNTHLSHSENNLNKLIGSPPSFSHIVISPFCEYPQPLKFNVSQQNNKVCQQEERFRYLLGIKQQQLNNCQKELQEAKRQCKQLEVRIDELVAIRLANKHKKLDDLSAIQCDSFREDSFADSASKENRQLNNTRKIICLKKAKKEKYNHSQTDQIQNSKDLQIAKLRLQLVKLNTSYNQLSVQMMVLQIDNDLLTQQNQLTNRRQRQLQTQIYDSFIHKKKQPKQISKTRNIRQKIVLSQKFINQIPQQDQIHQYKKHPEPVLPPITPHFSNSMANMFSKKSNIQYLYSQPADDQIIETQSEQDYF